MAAISAPDKSPHFQGAKSQAEALRQFQLRVLSLLELWLRKQPLSPLTPLCILPMLRALRAAVRPSGHAPTAKRLAAVLLSLIHI